MDNPSLSELIGLPLIGGNNLFWVGLTLDGWDLHEFDGTNLRWMGLT